MTPSTDPSSMIVYADTSALVKLFVTEPGSEETRDVLRLTRMMGTGLLTRSELGAALARSVRRNILSAAEGQTARQRLEAAWPTWAHIAVNEGLVQQAEALAWQYHLRGYDAVHLAAALTWQQRVAHPIMLATFDRELWEAAGQAGLVAWPETYLLLFEAFVQGAQLR